MPSYRSSSGRQKTKWPRAGNRPRPPGPFSISTADDNRPQVTDDEINNELGRLFEFVHVHPTLLENSINPVGIPGWSCLMLRPLVGKK